MAYTGGAEWGRFIQGINPAQDFTNAFLDRFKEGAAYKLAEAKAKAEQKQRELEEKAVNDYKLLQLQIQEQNEKRRQFEWEAEQKGQGERFNEQMKFNRESLGGKAPTPEEKELLKARIASEWAGVAKTQKETQGGLTNNQLRALDNEINSLMPRSSPHFEKFNAVRTAKTPAEVQKLYDELIKVAPDQESTLNAIAQKRKEWLRGGGDPMQETPPDLSKMPNTGTGVLGGFQPSTGGFQPKAKEPKKNPLDLPGF